LAANTQKPHRRAVIAKNPAAKTSGHSTASDALHNLRSSDRLPASNQGAAAQICPLLLLSVDQKPLGGRKKIFFFFFFFYIFYWSITWLGSRGGWDNPSSPRQSVTRAAENWFYQLLSLSAQPSLLLRGKIIAFHFRRVLNNLKKMSVLSLCWGKASERNKTSHRIDSIYKYGMISFSRQDKAVPKVSPDLISCGFKPAVLFELKSLFISILPHQSTVVPLK